MMPVPLTYLALGDSYTIGEAVSQEASFPFQLVALLNRLNAVSVNSPTIIAQTGWTTSELLDAIKATPNLADRYHFVTLLIGVNNQYRGQPTETYRQEFKLLLQMAIDFAGGNENRVFVVSIPDWGVTPFAKESGRLQEAIAEEINLFNAINQEETLKKNVSYTDITSGSRLASADALLLAADGLHPSGKMYQTWAEALVPKIEAVL